VYEIDDWSQVFSTSLTVLQSRVVAIATFMSRAAVLYDIRFNKYRKYRTTLEGFEIYCPTTAAATNRCRLFTMATVSMCLTCMLSTNCVKLYNLYAKHSDGYFVTTYFLFFYMQNCSIYLMESYFTHQCFMVYTAFREINGDLENVKRDTTDYARFPFLLDPRAWFPSATPSLSSCTVVYENDFYRPRDKGNPLANTVEFIKIKHWLIREAVTDLNDLFRIHLAISVVCLSVLMLFDVFIYFTATIDVTIFRSKFLFIGWLLQYSVRFFVLSITTNITTKQVKTNVTRIIAPARCALRYNICSTTVVYRVVIGLHGLFVRSIYYEINTFIRPTPFVGCCRIGFRRKIMYFCFHG
jgi:hypothetical protein